jgi:hypothetical protein
MATEIILHSTEDENTLLSLEKYCIDNNLKLTREDIVIKTYQTGLILCSVSGKNIKKDEIPGYNLYSPLYFEVEDSDLDQSALLAFLSMFYNTPVTFTIKDLDKEIYLAEGNREEVVEEGDTDIYIAGNVGIGGSVSRIGGQDEAKEERQRQDQYEVKVETQREEETQIIKGSNIELIYLFDDGDTPFYLETEKMDEYIKAFRELLGLKLVTTNPIIQSILKVYPEPAIKQYKDFDLWFSDFRFNASPILEKVEYLVKEGFFCVTNPNNITDEVITLYNFEKLSDIPLQKEERVIPQSTEENLEDSLVFNKDRALLTEIRVLEGLNPLSVYYGKLTERIPIRGPIIQGFRLDEDFFDSCVTQAQNGEVPSVNVKVNFICDRKTVAACILAMVDNLCDPCSSGNCKKCTYFSCAMLNDISVYSESTDKDQPFDMNSIDNYSLDEDLGNVGWISLMAGNFPTLKKVLEDTQANVERITIVNVTNIEEGLLYRFAFYRKGVKSLLLNDTEGYFVAVWDYEGIIPEAVQDIDGMEVLEDFEEFIPNTNDLNHIITGKAEIFGNISYGNEDSPRRGAPLEVYTNNLSSYDLEQASSRLENYSLYGKGYAHIGIYSIPNVLPGLLDKIPVPDRSSYRLNKLQLAAKIKEIVYEVTSDGEKIATLTENSPEDLETTLEDLYAEYTKQYDNITINAWEKNYINTVGTDPFIYCLGKDCPFIVKR